MKAVLSAPLRDLPDLLVRFVLTSELRMFSPPGVLPASIISAAAAERAEISSSAGSHVFSFPSAFLCVLCGERRTPSPQRTQRNAEAENENCNSCRHRLKQLSIHLPRLPPCAGSPTMKPLLRRALPSLFLTLAVFGLAILPTSGQEKSVRPGINKPFEDPDVQEYLGKFEVESREVFGKRHEIIAACKLKPGIAVPAVGAGTGLFTRLFAKAAGPKGKVYAVDIAPKFVAHV